MFKHGNRIKLEDDAWVVGFNIGDKNQSSKSGRNGSALLLPLAITPNNNSNVQFPIQQFSILSKHHYTTSIRNLEV